jgi:endonuclease YncB( thermonuclease family)
VDGDTIGFGSERIRILNIDAPESYQPNCEKELVAGLKAKERLAQLVRAGMVSVQREGKDRYGRTLARLSVDGRDIGETLIREGFALPWQEGASAKQARTARWCT